MNLSIIKRKRTILILISFILCSIAIFSWSKSENINNIRRRMRDAFSKSENQRAEEAYKKRNSETIPWAKHAMVPNPDNAALLYYQAFLIRPEPNTVTLRKIDNVLRGAEPDRQIRRYLGYCLPMIEIVEIASRIPECTWGIWQGSELNLGYRKFLFQEVSYLTHILSVDARVAAIDGNYQVALDRCLTIRRLARHISNNSELDLYARNPDLWALRTIQYVLSVIPPDEDLLLWFRGQLSVVHGLRLSVTNMFQDELRPFLNRIQTDPAFVRHLRRLLIENAEDKQAEKNARNLTDEQIRSCSRKEFPRFVESILQILDSEMTYEQKSAKMQKMISDIKERDSIDPISTCIILASGIEDLVDRQYPFLVGYKAHINAIKTAVEVYLIVAKMGRLPEKLPNHLPKDPFTGQAFIYEITDEGFALLCQDREFLRRKNEFLKFKVVK